MKFLKNALIGGLSLLLAQPALATSLMDVFHLAIDNDAQLSIAKAKLELAKEDNPQALAKWLPTINVEGRYGKVSQELQGGALVQPSELAGYQFDDVWYEVNITQPLFYLPAYHDMKLADARALHATAEYRYAQQYLLYRVVEAYFDVLSKEQKLNIARETKKTVSDILQQAEKLRAKRKVPQFDVDAANARHDMAIISEVDAENQVAHAREKLREITGETHSNLRTLKDNTPLAPPTPTNIDAWVDTALKQNLGLTAAQLKIEIAKRQIRRHKSEHMPQVSFSASYGRYTDGAIFGTQSAEKRYGVDFKMPIFAGGITSSKVRKARRGEDLAKEELRILENELITNTRRAYLNVLAGMSYIRAMNHALGASQSALNGILRTYDSGRATVFELLNAVDEFYTTRGRYDQIRYEFIVNTMQLRATVGMLTIDDLEMTNNWLD
jgi:outer membrane protein